MDGADTTQKQEGGPHRARVLYPLRTRGGVEDCGPRHIQTRKTERAKLLFTNLLSLREMASLSLASASASVSVSAIGRSTKSRRSCPSSLRISCVGWDPEGLLGPPQAGHIARREFHKRLEKDADAREAFTRQVREEKERRRALRQSRVVPETAAGLIEYFLDTEARELEFEIARLRPRLDKEFFMHLQSELGQLRFSVSRTKDMEDRLIELEAMQKVLIEGSEAYDKMQSELILAKQRLAKILQSEDKKATLLDMVEQNELDKSLLALLDENIVSAHQNNQKQVAEYMEKIRAAVLKYITV